MGTVIFVMLPEPGHMNPSFKLAKTLQKRGHQVCYISIQDCEADIRAQGLSVIPIFEEMLPRGYQANLALNASGDPTFKGDMSVKCLIDDQMRIIYDHKSVILDLVEKLGPDLFIVDNLLPAMVLVAHELGVPSIFLNVTFNGFDDYQGTKDLLPILKVPELILCPQEFDMPNSQYGVRRRLYIEPSIDLDRKEPPFPWGLISKDKPLIYCSLGTQSHFYKKESMHLYRCLIEAMAARDHWQLVLAIGSHLSVEQFRPTPSNVVVVNKAPQLEMLKRAALMITHGGLGSVKECIFFEVPMVVLPLGRDQLRNAARVAYHSLGARGDIKNISVDIIQSFIDKIDRNPSFKTGVKLMGGKFREAENLERGVKIIEKLMGACERREVKKATCRL